MAPLINPNPAARRGGTAGRRVLANALTVLAAITGVFVGQSAAAQSTAHRHLASRGSGSADAQALGVLPPARLVPLQAAMTQAYPTIGANADGSDLWPCFGRTTPNGDCPTIGNPALPLPLGSMVTGRPALFIGRCSNDDIFGFGLGNGIGCDALRQRHDRPRARPVQAMRQLVDLLRGQHLRRQRRPAGARRRHAGPDVIFDSGS